MGLIFCLTQLHPQRARSKRMRSKGDQFQNATNIHLRELSVVLLKFFGYTLFLKRTSSGCPMHASLHPYDVLGRTSFEHTSFLKNTSIGCTGRPTCWIWISSDRHIPGISLLYLGTSLLLTERRIYCLSVSDSVRLTVIWYTGITVSKIILRTTPNVLHFQNVIPRKVPCISSFIPRTYWRYNIMFSFSLACSRRKDVSTTYHVPNMINKW